MGSICQREEQWVWRAVLVESELGLGWLAHKYYCTLIGATLDNVLTFSNCPKWRALHNRISNSGRQSLAALWTQSLGLTQRWLCHIEGPTLTHLTADHICDSLTHWGVTWRWPQSLVTLETCNPWSEFTSDNTWYFFIFSLRLLAQLFSAYTKFTIFSPKCSYSYQNGQFLHFNERKIAYNKNLLHRQICLQWTKNERATFTCQHPQLNIARIANAVQCHN